MDGSEPRWASSEDGSVEGSAERAAGSSATRATARSTRRRAALARLAREPLLHFALLGGSLFALDAALSHGASTRSHVIVLDADDRRAAAAAIADRLGRPPTEAELSEALERRGEAEALYRHGLSLGLDEDPTIREMIISRTRAVLQSQIGLPEPSGAALRQYHEQHRSDYDVPARRRLRHHILSSTLPDGEARARRLLSELSGGADPARHAGLSKRETKTRAQLAALYGRPFAAGVFAAPVGRWTLLSSTRGLHVARVDEQLPPRAVPFEEVEARVRRDHEARERQERYAEALRAVRDAYEVRLAPDDAKGPSPDSPRPVEPEAPASGR